jgi:hypothetical protein
VGREDFGALPFVNMRIDFSVDEFSKRVLKRDVLRTIELRGRRGHGVSGVRVVGGDAVCGDA